MRTARLRNARPVLWAGWAALATGAVLCVLGWYGISGERYAERQMPYLASCTVPGAALIIAAAILLTHGRDAVAGARVEELYGLLVAAGLPEADEGGQGAAAPVAVGGELLTVPGGTLWHRADCPLVAGKPAALPVDSRVLAGGDLGPCPICEPAAPAGPPGPTGPADRSGPGAPDGPSSGPGPSDGPSSGPGALSGPSSGAGPSDAPSPAPGASDGPSPGPGPSDAPSSGPGPSDGPSSGAGG